MSEQTQSKQPKSSVYNWGHQPIKDLAQAPAKRECKYCGLVSVYLIKRGIYQCLDSRCMRVQE